MGQKSSNDDAQNQKYPDLDSRVERYYAQGSSASSVKALYDSYIKAFRWATDRLDSKNGGVIGFITNGGWIDSKGMDVFRKCLEKEFSKIYVYNLRGDQRTSGELSRKEGGKIFGSGSRTPVAITILVKKPSSSSLRESASNEAIQKKAVIKYRDIGDYLSREDKLKIVRDAESITHLEMTQLHPNEHGDWINLRNENFGKWTPIEPEKKFEINNKSWFLTNSLGVASGRDAWCSNFSRNKLENNMISTINFYNEQRKSYINSGAKKFEDFVNNDSTKISWNDSLRNDCSKNVPAHFDKSSLRDIMYRPFTKQKCYFQKQFIQRTYQQTKFFPNAESQNIVICVQNSSGKQNLTPLISDSLVDLHFDGDAQCFPLYYYEEPKTSGQTDIFASNDKYVRKDAISDYILKQARTQYKDPKIRKEDIFYYVYGFLHCEDYRTEFSADLKKMLPRIPLVDTADDFWAFSKAGRKLAEIHLNYEQAEPYKALIISASQVASELPIFSGMAANIQAFFSAEAPETLYKVRQMRFAKKSGYDSKGKAKNVDDKTRIIYNEKIAIAGIPEEAYEYVVNGKSAIEWIMERYAITTDKASGIVNDPNDWALEHNNPQYIFNLVLRIITVSLETMKIVKSLPKVKF